MDAVIIAVTHHQFRAMDTGTIRNFMKNHPVLIDVSDMVDSEEAERLGIPYQCL
jgi:UDP-N-acetyl-D-mannosaminuronate dehydrogenase